jgi:MFS family permease
MNSSAIKVSKGLDLAIWLFLFGRMVSNIGEQLLLYAIPLMIFDYTHDVGKSGQAFLIEWLPAVLLLPFLGSVTDRFTERRVYFGSEMLRALVCTGAFLSLLAGLVSPFITLAVTVAALGVLHSQNSVALETTIIRRFGTENIARVQSLVEGLEGISEVMGPALAGLLVGIVTKQWLLAMSAGVFIVSGASVLALVAGTRQAPERPAKEPILRGVRRGFSIVLTMSRLLALAGISMSLNLLLGVVLATNPAVAKSVLGVSDFQFALIGTTSGVVGATLMFCLPVLMKKMRSTLLASLSFFLLCLAGGLLGTARSFAPFVAGFTCLNCAIGMFNVYVCLERAKAIPQAEFGRAIGVIILLTRLGMPLAGALVAVGSRVMEAQSLVLMVASAAVLTILSILRYLMRTPSPVVTEPIIGATS